jgi:hypothetical protein
VIVLARAESWMWDAGSGAGLHRRMRQLNIKLRHHAMTHIMIPTTAKVPSGPVLQNRGSKRVEVDIVLSLPL